MALVIVAFSLATGGCGTAPLVVRGSVVEVRSDGPIEWQSVVVRNDAGEVLEFERGLAVDLRFWSASHLQHHALLGLPVAIQYEVIDNALVATAITD